MASHRAADGGLGSGPSGTPSTVAGKRRAAGAVVDNTSPSTYVGQRVARARDYEPPVPVAGPILTSTPDLAAAPPAAASIAAAPIAAAPPAQPTAPPADLAVSAKTLLEPTRIEPAPAPDPAPALDISALLALSDHPAPAEPTPAAGRRSAGPPSRRRGPAADPAPGRRASARHTGRRGRLFKALPPGPVLAGVATMSVAVLGALTSGVSSDLSTRVSSAESTRVVAASALSGTTGEASTSLLARRPGVSRDSERDATGDVASTPLEKRTEAQAEQHDAAVLDLRDKVEKQARKIELNLWTLPVEGYHLTNTFGEAHSYYSSGYHTGLDFAAPYGTPIHAIANGVVTETGYDGAYGNKTVVTLDDGTEIWFCHQSGYAVSTGDTVTAGELIGYVGETGNAYGAHLHIEVHIGGGDASDPYTAFIAHGVTP